MTSVPEALVALAPRLEGLERRMEAEGCKPSPLSVVRQASLVADKTLFSQLPPMLLHEDPRPTANKLYGGAHTSPVEHAAYRAGTFDGAPLSDCVILGAALFDLNDRAYPVLLYEHRKDEVCTIVAHVYQAPLAELEAQLFDERIAPTPFESRWFGEELAQTTHRLRLATGGYLRSGGLASMPGMLLTGDCHLVRPGVLPWLHFRGPKTDHERDTLVETVTAGLSVHATHGNPAPIEWQDEIDAQSGQQRLLTVFDRCAIKPSAELASAEAMQKRAPDVEKLVQQSLWGRLVDVARGILLVNDGKPHLHARDLLSASLPLPELEEASAMARAPPALTLNRLTGMVKTCGVTGLTSLDQSGRHSQSSLEKIAAATFAASDAVLAFRDVSVQNAAGHPDAGCIDMATRIDEPQAMLVVRIDAGYEVQKAHLVNSALCHEIRNFDEMARLVAYPWVTVVVHRLPSPDERGAWFLFDTSLVDRDKLRVTDQVRKTFGAAPAKPPPPAASPEALEQLRTDMNSRLERLEAQFKEGGAPSSASQPAAPTESALAKSVRANVQILTRLVRKRSLAVSEG